MRKLFIFLMVMFGALIGRAATPTLTNFNLQHFVINQVGAPTNVIKLHVNPSEFVVNAQGLTFIGGNSATNALTNLYVQNFLTTNFFAIQTNLFFTNLYVSNIFVTNITIEGGTIINTNTLIENTFVTNITDNSTTIFTNSTVIFTNSTVVINGTNVATLGDLVFTNSAGFIYSLSPHTTISVTNLTSDSTLTARGAFITIQQTASPLSPGNNVVDTTGKALIYLIGSSTNDIVQLSTGNGPGSHIWLLNASTNSTFSLPSGPLSDNPLLNVYVRGGLWQPSELGESIELLAVGGGWDEIGRSNPNGPAPLAALINPTDGYIPYRSNATTFADSPLHLIAPGIVSGQEIDLNVLFTFQQLIAGGSFMTIGQSIQLLDTGTNVVNPTGLAQIYLIPTNINSVVQLDTGYGQGQHLWIFNVFTNAPFTMYSGPLADNTNAVLVLRGGSWTPTEVGESLELVGTPNGWVEIGRSNPNGPAPALGTNYWTNITVGGVSSLTPLDASLQPLIINGLAVGTNTLADWGGALSGGEVFVGIRNTDHGDPDLNQLFTEVKNDAAERGVFNVLLQRTTSELQLFNQPAGSGPVDEIDLQTSTGQAQLTLLIQGSVVTALKPAATGIGDSYTFDTSVTRTNGNVAAFRNFGVTNLLVRFDGSMTPRESASAPGTPPSGFYTLYAVDNGAGKMKLMVQFPTGAAQQIAIEP